MMTTVEMTKSAKTEFDDRIYEMQVRICKAFANTSRLRMLDILAMKECSASELQAELKISAANVSQHLAILKAAGVVAARRNGKQMICSLAIPEVKDACRMIRDVLRAQVRKDSKLVVGRLP